MCLHEGIELFEEIVYNTADAFKLPVAIIEKDKLPASVLENSHVAVELSQQEKLFKIE